MFLPGFLKHSPPLDGVLALLVRQHRQRKSRPTSARVRPQPIGQRNNPPFWQYQFYCCQRENSPEPLTTATPASPGNLRFTAAIDSLSWLSWLSRTALAIRSKSACSKSLCIRQSCRANLCRAHSVVSGRPSAVQSHLDPLQCLPTVDRRRQSSKTPRPQAGTSVPAKAALAPPHKSASGPRRCTPAREPQAVSVSFRPRAVTRPSTSGMMSVVVEPMSTNSPAPLGRIGRQTAPAHANCWPPPSAATELASASGTSRPSTR